MVLLPILASERRPLLSSSQFMNNKTGATILGMTQENLVIMRLNVMIVEATRFHLKACAAMRRLTLWLVTDGVLKAPILGRHCRTQKIVAVVPRRGNKKSSLSHNLKLNLKCLRSILLPFRQRRRKSLLLKRKGARGQTPKSLRKKVLRKE